MIRLHHVSKAYAGHAVPAVHDLTLEVPAGQTCVLIGPSGCGKTTTMKMINRLIEPTTGRIEVAGRDVSTVDPVELRRGIGYVIQQIGLFPHMTIAQNVATVPALLRWTRSRIDERVDEMLTLVSLDPAVYRSRYPRELSGGQRQRVGVARALAGDPPVMLMDEPFGAVDPITRARLQNEFLRILQSLRKTIVFVTHDVDEAIRMGDRIAILRDGRLVQDGAPGEVLAHPANAFVEEFLGRDRELKRLDLVAVREIMATDLVAFTAGGEARDALRTAPTIPEHATVRDALASLLGPDVAALVVVDAEGRPVGLVSLAMVQRLAGRQSSAVRTTESRPETGRRAAPRAD